MTLPSMLFVDDRTKRLHAALERYGKEYEVTLATNVKEALRALSANDYAVVSLDHDLTGCDFEDPETPTCGMEIVRYLEKTSWPHGKPMPEFIIHSSNIFAGHLMYIRLNQMGFRTHQERFDYTRQQEMEILKGKTNE